MKLLKSLINRILQFRTDPLYMNSLYVMLSVALVSGSGFFMWMIGAKLYPEAYVGLATSLVSVVGFIMTLSILGFNYSIIRFLPKSRNKSRLLSTALVTVAGTAALCASVFLMFLPFFSKQHLFLWDNPLIILAFLFLSITIAVDFATEAIFLAIRKAKYILLKNIGIVFLKLLLPILFVPFGAFGLFMAWAVAISSALFVSGYILLKKCKFTFIPSFKKINLAQLLRFSFANYIVSLSGVAPALVSPVIIANTINAESAAYFYISFMIANLLYTIPYAATQSLFAEGSHDEKQFFLNMKKAVKLLSLTLLPAILILLFFGQYILMIFGKSYSTEGIRFLQLLAITGIPMALNLFGHTILNIHKKMKPLLSINIAGVVTILVLSYFLKEHALTGIGIAWLVGHTSKTFLYTVYLAFNFVPLALLKHVFALHMLRAR